MSSGRFTFVGDEVVVVGGQRVPAHRFRQLRTLSGNQTGTQTTDFCFATKDGLPLRNRRTATVHADTAVGTSTYTEHGGFALISLQAQR